MKKYLLHKILWMSRLFMYVFLLQALFITLLKAEDANAQWKSIYDMYVSIDVENEEYSKVFSALEKQSSINFTYNRKSLSKKLITVSANNQSLGNVLEDISMNSDFMFKRVNGNIHVNKKPVSVKSEVSEVSVIEAIVSGTVEDEEGNSIPGVSIVEKGTTNGTVTDVDGKYSLNVAEDGVLVFSFVGYLTQEITVNGRSQIDIILSPDIATLQEVVVVGYGTQKKANLTGSVSSVGEKEIANRPITSAATALQGTVSGVYVNQNSGQAGRDNVQINIRGIGTLNNSDPLVLVDGIEAPLNNINPDDIETVTVLKDAASAAIYGSRAANGVVLVTTKRGSRGDRITFDYNGYVGTSETIRLPEMVTNSVQFAELWNEGQANFGNPPKYSPEEIEGFRQRGINTDWIDVVFKKGLIQQHNISVSGGSEKTNFRFSLGYLDQDGTIPNSTFKRYNSRFNLDTYVNDKVRIGTSLSLIRGEINAPGDNVLGDGNVAGLAIQGLPFNTPYDDQGRFASPLGLAGRANPMAIAASREYNELSYDMLGNVYLNYEIIEGLNVKGTAAINYRTENEATFNNLVEIYDIVTGNVTQIAPLRGRSRSANQALNVTTWLQASYDKSFGPHNIKALIGFNQEEHNSDWFNTSRNGQISNSVKTLSSGDASTAANDEGGTTWALQSYFGRLNYNFEEKYLFEANLRYDGTSRFLNEKWGAFPSFSAGWVVSEEGFFENVGAVNFLKLRASWGKLGNQNIGDFRFAKSLSLTQAYSFGGTLVPGVALTDQGNADLTWESTSMSDIGLNLGLFNSKIELEADYFIRNTSNILYDLPSEITTGFSSQISNAAEVKNEGWELGLTYNDSFGDFNLSVSGNVTHVKSTVEELNPTIPNDGSDRAISGRTIIEPGSPINSYFGYQAVGIFRTQDEFDNAADHSGLDPNYGVGDVWLADISGPEGVPDGVITPDDRTVIGYQNPVWSYGFNFRMAYKGFDLFALFQGAADFNGYSSEELAAPFFNTSGLQARWVDRWTPDNPDGSMPRMYVSTGPSNSTNNTFWMFDRSYLRMKNLQIGYTLPQRILDNIFIQSIRVYANGSNLFTVTDFPYLDPERPPGADRGTNSYPNLRIITGGLNIKF